MRLQAFPVSAAVALVVGATQCWLMLFFWVHISAHSPLFRWLFALGLRGVPLSTILYAIDFLTGVVLSLPAALLVARLRPSNRLWLYLLLAMIPWFVWLNKGFMGSPPPPRLAGPILLGWLLELLTLPAAVWLLSRRLGRGAPNNSFQPKPLRGSA